MIRSAGAIAWMAVAACASYSPATARYDQFPTARGQYPVKSIAILPGAGALADAVGVELAKRGFVVVQPSATAQMVKGVDFKAVSVPGRADPALVEDLKYQLHSRGVDAFLIVRADDFVARQAATYHLYRTHPEVSSFSYYTWLWQNRDKDRPRSPAEAAAESVTTMARRTGGP